MDVRIDRIGSQSVIPLLFKLPIFIFAIQHVMKAFLEILNWMT